MKTIVHVGQRQYFEKNTPSKIPGWKTSFHHVNFDWQHPEVFDFLKDLDADVAVFYCMERMPPAFIEKFEGKKIWYSTEPVHREFVLQQYENCEKTHSWDLHLHYSADYPKHLKKFQAQSLPMNLDVFKPIKCKKDFDAIFVGRATDYRTEMLQYSQRDFNVLWIESGLDMKELNEFQNRSLFGINLSLNGELVQNPRIQQYLASGIPVITSKTFDFLSKQRYIYEINSNIDLHRILDDEFGNYKEGYSVLSKKAREFAEENYDANHIWKEILRDFE